ncbi:thiol peroxidase [Rothia sp. LK2588]|uniref:thiol peroxidase n=1 Tax=Rothia sp. LK2588 TaxID=3114369 RepID=UPI0034CDD7B0
MAETKFQGESVTTSGDLPEVGSVAPEINVAGTDLSDISLADFKGKRVVLNIFPSVDTGVCAQSVRTFNEKASKLENTTVLCISKDLPFALDRFCAAEGIENVVSASAFRSTFGEDYGVTQASGPLAGLLARAVIVLDEAGKVTYTQLVPEITEEPNYDEALNALK